MAETKLPHDEYELVDGSAWFTVGGFSVKLHLLSDNELDCQVYALDREDEESLAGCRATLEKSRATKRKENLTMDIIKRFGSQPAPAVIVLDPEFYECGICSCFHPAAWDGDCRDDANRFCGGVEQLDDLFPGWVEVDMPI